MGSKTWDLRVNSSHICQWDHPGPNNPIEKILECFSPFDDWQSLGNLWDIRIILILPVLECFPLDLKIAHYLIQLDVCCSEVPSYSLIIPNEITCHSQPLLRLGSICECWHWDCCSNWCIWVRISNSSSRLPHVVCKLLEGFLFKICKICNQLNSFSLHLNHGCMWYPHLVWAFKRSCGLCCSQYHDYFSQFRVRVVIIFGLLASFFRVLITSFNGMLANWAFKPLFSLDLKTCNLCLKLEFLAFVP